MSVLCVALGLAAAAMLAGLFTQTWTISVQTGSNVLATASYQDSQSEQLAISIQIPANQTNYQIACAMTKSKIKEMIFLADQTGTVLKTNSTGTPQDNWTFTANVPVVWSASMPTSNPLGGDLTSLYWTTGASAVNVTVVFLYIP